MEPNHHDNFSNQRKFIPKTMGSTNRSIGQANDSLESLRELSKRKITDKVFYEKLKPMLDQLLDSVL